MRHEWLGHQLAALVCYIQLDFGNTVVYQEGWDMSIF
jgi:hypothetical protein